MAQCCTRQWEIDLSASQKKAHQARELTISTTTSPTQKKVTCLPTNEVLNPPNLRVENGDDMSLVFAEKCLRNAHYLLLRRYRGRKSTKARDDDEAEKAEHEDEDAAADEGDGLLEESELHSASEEDPVMASVLQSVYVHMTYVALCLNNPAVALASAQKLLSLPSLFKESRIVCLSYCAEAYCRLGRPQEALNMLHKVNLQELVAPVCRDQRCQAISQSTLQNTSENQQHNRMPRRALQCHVVASSRTHTTTPARTCRSSGRALCTLAPRRVTVITLGMCKFS